MPVVTPSELSNFKTSDTVYFTFGRFQPPTVGHQHMIQQCQIIAQTKNYANEGYDPGDYFVVPTKTYEDVREPSCKKRQRTAPAPPSTTDPTTIAKNMRYPLDLNTKLEYMNMMFHDVNILDIRSIGGRMNDVVEAFKHAGYKTVVLLVGYDPDNKFKVQDMITIPREMRLNQANATTWSATEMRIAAATCNFNKFKAGLPKFTDDAYEQYAEHLMALIMKNMNIPDSSCANKPKEHPELFQCGGGRVGRRRILLFVLPLVFVGARKTGLNKPLSDFRTRCGRRGGSGARC
jgi:hypothetical protein